MPRAYAEEPAAAADGAEEAAPLAPPAGEQPKKLRYSDADFLRLVGDERKRSIGFGEGDTGELAKARIKSQQYRQGKITDLKVLEGRSAAVDTTYSDAIDTVMPDIMEVFFGGEDVITFDADGELDEAQASEESDVIAKIIFGHVGAFRAFHDCARDGLENRLGLFHWWFEDKERPIGEQVAESTQEATLLAALVAEKMPATQASVEQREDGTIVLSFSELRGGVCFKAVPSEDFTVAADTVLLPEATYCALRDRVRLQELIARGIDAAKARNLPAYSSKQDGMEQSRDESGEHDRANEEGIDDLRIVEVRAHYLRVDADGDGKPELWRIETDVNESVLLQKEQVTHIPFGAWAPFLNPHRFYGESLFDKLAEVMRIKTVLLRMLLDSGYFALNQRFEVSEASANEFTIADLLNNAPNVPVRSKDGNAVRALSAGQLGFEVLSAIEFMSTVGEQRSGVVRNAQGLNPDTLHETASGVQQLIAAAQKRVRFMCRIMAETAVKDLVLGVHRMLREQFTPKHAPLKRKVGAKWKDIRPDEWPEREEITVHVGVGSGGKERDLKIQELALNLTKEIIGLQGGVQGPFVTPANVYNRLKAFSRAAGEKDVSQYWTEPSEAPAQQGEGQQQPHPEMVKAQNEHSLAQAKLQIETQANAQKAQFEQELAKLKLQGELQLQAAKQQGLLELERMRAEAALSLQREELAATQQLQRERLTAGVAHSANVSEEFEALPGSQTP